MKKSEATKLKILSAAIELFSKNGFHQVTFQQIADRIEMTQPSIFYHYKNKDELLQGCLDHILAKNTEIVQREKQGKSTLQANVQSLINANLEWAYRYPEQVQLVLFMNYSACFNQEHAKELDGMIRRGAQRVKENLQDFKHKDISLELSMLFQKFTFGCIFQIVGAPNPSAVYQESQDQAKKLVKELLG